MLPPYSLLRKQLHFIIEEKRAQGHDVSSLEDDLAHIPDNYEKLMHFAHRLSDLPFEEGWPYVEPDDLASIWAEASPDRPIEPITDPDLDQMAERSRIAFLSAACGCTLGKPIEMSFDFSQIRDGLIAIGSWPLQDYFPEAIVEALDIPYPVLWEKSVKERIAFVPPDDDLNYKILNMLLLEDHGTTFNQDDIRSLWLQKLPIEWTFGPERALLIKAGIQTLEFDVEKDLEEWATVLNPREEWCGALIRADTFGYACPGDPSLAAELAWRDSSWTHRRTGIYGAMFIAAAVAVAPFAVEPMEIFATALKFIPQRSRLHEVVNKCIDEVKAASDWMDGYNRIHDRFGEYGFCRIYQEIGTLINTLCFAKDVGEGLCMQVCQGNDTDSFGAIAGSILGMYLGPDRFDQRWIEPFHDEIRTTIAGFYERSLQRVAERMSHLPEKMIQKEQPLGQPQGQQELS
jgi:ADP-ribosylglycohydrolase